MKHSQVALLLFISVLNVSPRACLAVTTTNPEDVVQLLTGTDTVDGGSNSDGNTLPQIKMPWGFNDWVPQTSGDKGSWFFHRDDTTFQGLRCTHQPSPWIGDYGHFLLQPHIGEEFQDLEWDAKMASIRPYLFNASWNGGVGLEFAPTSHAAILRLTFPTSEKFGHLSLNVGEANEGDVEVKAPQNKDVYGEPNGMIIRGYTKINSGGVPDNWRGMFFTVHSSQALVSGGETKDQPGVQKLNFRTDQGPVIVTVATSFISPKQADLNLKQEVGKKSFHDVVETGRATWSQQLGRVKVDAIDKTQLAVFYTNLWKSMLFPRYLQETDAKGNERHRSPYTGKITSGKLVADSGFWDSYRTVYQLQSMVFSDNLGSLIDGWVDAYKEAKWLPQWASPGQHASMVGTMGDVVLADAIAKSKWGLLKGFDVDKAYEAIRKDAFANPIGLYGRAGLQEYIDLGYVPSDDQSESVSRTLNYYVSDAAIARVAGLLGAAAAFWSTTAEPATTIGLARTTGPREKL